MSGGAKAAVAIGLVAAIAAAAVALVVVGGDDEPGPDATARAFVEAWNDGDGEAMRALALSPAALDTLDPLRTADDLGVTATRVDVGAADEDRDGARAPITITWTLADVGDVTWDGALPLFEDRDDGWSVDWAPAALHPALPEGGTIVRSVAWDPRAPILGAGDQQLIGDVETIRIGIEPRRFDRTASLPILAAELGLDPAAIEAALDAPGVEPDHFVQIADLRPEEFAAVEDVVGPMPGVPFQRSTARGGPTTGFARHVTGRYGEVTAERLEELGSPYRMGDRVGLDGIEARFERVLAGSPAIELRVVDAAGELVQSLASFPATPPQPMRTTLDPEVQAAAEAALADVAVPAALVAVDAATGEVRAAVSRPLDEAFDRGIGGAYPPGSTFKVITAYALLSNGTTADTVVECPAEQEVDGRRFRNFEGGVSGSVPFRQAFAESCNTAMIGAAEALPDGALAEAAATFGFGVDYSLGPTTLGGSFPDPGNATERAAAAIGQAQVTASPLHMASVAAAVLDGTWRQPVLLPGETTDERVTRPLDPAVRQQLADLMRLVVTDGSGTAADVPGLDVIGKTGTAEFGEGDPPPTHAWFVAGARGLGIAVVLEGGGVGGRDAAPVAARFLEALE